VTLKFRNLEVDPSDPVEQWGPEGLLAAGDRGEVEDWARIYAAVDRDPYGGVAQTLLEDVAETASTRGVAEIMVRHVHEARAQAIRRTRTRSTGSPEGEACEARCACWSRVPRGHATGAWTLCCLTTTLTSTAL
jgi:hypothetical protein